MSQIQERTIRTPFLIHVFFHTLLISPILLAFAIYGAIEVSAKSCTELHSEMFFRQPPVALQQRCGKVWTRMNNRMIEEMAQNERFYSLPFNQ